MSRVCPTDDSVDGAANLLSVKEHIASAVAGSGRAPETVSLVAVSKNFEAAAIQPIIKAGQRVFGENRVQEATNKWPLLKVEYPAIRLHLIGPLQTNKVHDAMALFDVIETLDRFKLAGAIARVRDQIGSCPDLFVQVNTGEEEQKTGVWPGDVDSFIDRCRKEFALPVHGLMCIPPINEEPSLHFGLLREIAHRHDIERLSMGMSADYQIAIAFGATHVRVGTAIFGERQVGRPRATPL